MCHFTPIAPKLGIDRRVIEYEFLQNGFRKIQIPLALF